MLFPISAYYGTKTNNFILALTWNKSYFAPWDRESSAEKLNALRANSQLFCGRRNGMRQLSVTRAHSPNIQKNPGSGYLKEQVEQVQKLA